eukprot:394126_1
MEDSGALPIECDVDSLNMYDVIDIYPHAGKITRHGTDELITEFQLKTPVIYDEVRAGGRIPLIIGRGLTARARESLGMPPTDLFTLPANDVSEVDGYTLAQKMVGRACGLPEGK